MQQQFPASTANRIVPDDGSQDTDDSKTPKTDIKVQVLTVVQNLKFCKIGGSVGWYWYMS